MSRTSAVDRAAAVPLYHQIFLQLRDEILDGQRVFGAAVPTEQELSGKFDVSRITARRALDELAQHHFVARKRRVGTTVIFRAPAKPIEAKIDQAVDSLLELGRATTVKVLEVSRGAATAPVAELLHLAHGAKILRATRVRFLDGAPLGYVVSYVPDEFRKIVTRSTLARTPILAIIKKAGYRLGKATQVIAAILADPVVSEALEVEPRSAILRISRTVYDTSARPLLLTFAHYRSDMYHLRIDLNP